jgi:hypothetical protein
MKSEKTFKIMTPQYFAKFDVGEDGVLTTKPNTLGRLYEWYGVGEKSVYWAYKAQIQRKNVALDIEIVRSNARQAAFRLVEKATSKQISPQIIETDIAVAKRTITLQAQMVDWKQIPSCLAIFDSIVSQVCAKAKDISALTKDATKPPSEAIPNPQPHTGPMHVKTDFAKNAAKAVDVVREKWVWLTCPTNSETTLQEYESKWAAWLQLVEYLVSINALEGKERLLDQYKLFKQISQTKDGIKQNYLAWRKSKTT